MALQLGALRDALKEAGASDQMARQAAEEVAGYESRLGAIEQRITELRGHIDQAIAALRAHVDHEIAALRAHVDQEIAALRAYVDQRFTALEGRVNLLTWMVGTFGAVQVALLVRLLFVH